MFVCAVIYCVLFLCGFFLVLLLLVAAHVIDSVLLAVGFRVICFVHNSYSVLGGSVFCFVVRGLSVSDAPWFCCRSSV